MPFLSGLVWRKPKAPLVPAGLSHHGRRHSQSRLSLEGQRGPSLLFGGYGDTGAKPSSPWVSRCLIWAKLLAMVLGTCPSPSPRT